jgi:pSer/pThr/pTyr-binding forkhead associated (FHA) protein
MNAERRRSRKRQADERQAHESPRRASELRGWLVPDDPARPRVALPGQGEPAVIIGRGASCDAQAPDDAQVSRQHARLTWLWPDWWTVTDLGSSNGTMVGDRLISAPTPVTAGRVIQVGQTVYRIEVTG